MQQVHNIRKRVVDGMSRELDKICVFVSTIDGNRTCVEALKGKLKVELLADICELVMVHMGRETEVTRQTEGHVQGTSMSQARRYAR